MAQFYPMKAVLEQLFGRRCYKKLKETGTLKDWKAESNRLLRAIEVAIYTTVEIADPEWRPDIKSELDSGRRHIDGAETITSLFANLSATLTRLVFLQLGCFPSRCTAEVVPVVATNWRLNSLRSVQYVQTAAQSAEVARLSARQAAAQKITPYMTGKFVGASIRQGVTSFEHHYLNLRKA